MDNYNYKNYIYKIILICCLPLWINFSVAQDRQDIQIANEYLSKGDKEKALLLFQQLVKKNENIPFIHTNYLNLLIDIGKYEEAESYLDKLIRRDDKLNHRLDLGVLYFRSGNLARADKYLRAYAKELEADTYKLKSAADYLASKNLTEYAILYLHEARSLTKNSSMFALELANYYRLVGKRDQMVEEYLNYVTQTPSNSSYIKNVMQILLTKPEELESLEKLLLDRIQANPNSEVFADLIIWVNLQQKNFYGAFIQSRAYDKRFRKEQSKTLEIAQIALNNQDYDNADRCFAHVIKEFAGTDNELPARLGLIRTREAKVKKSYPVNKDSVRYLIGEYDRFKSTYADNANSFEAALNQALLHAYYLQEMDPAIELMQGLIANNRVGPAMRAKVKIELGDIYVLKEEPWEATLLYSQVEKSQRETPQGYEAKLKNARLSYYKGEFKLAQEHLDILKQATTREIANDAMELSMRIKENTTFDTLGTDLKQFAAIELLVAQNKTQQALEKLAVFTDGDANRMIKDDACWLEATLRLKAGEFQKALTLYEKIVSEFGEDLLADDAYFMQGEVYERYLNNKEKAMEIYREFLTRYPGSVYVAEARKRFRTLRGDFDEKHIN
jgi:tetratricopeptide (TPR) repeat protein